MPRCMLSARRTSSDGSMPASGSAGPGFDPRRGIKFSFENFQPRARRGGDVHFLIARLYITGPSAVYVEKGYSTVDSDSSVGWGR